jgi:hypothetical protein
MGELVNLQERRKRKEQELHMVSVTLVLPWAGSNPDHAADQAAKAILSSAEHVADFYGKSLAMWGPVSE